MEDETRQDPSSTAASYWLVAATRGAGDLDRSWAAAAAAWVRAVLAPDRGAALRADIDRLVTQALIPDRASRADPHDRRQAMATMIGEWEEFRIELEPAVGQPFASFQFSPTPTSTVSGTVSVTADCISSRTRRGRFLGHFPRRLEQQLVVHGEDHPGPSARDLRQRQRGRRSSPA